MAASNVSEFYRACHDNNLATVRRLLPSISIPTLNSLGPNGSSCLHAASSSGNRDIIRLLLENGASRLIKDRDGRTPVDVAPTREVAEMFARLPEEAFQHYAVTATSNEPVPDWLFGQDKAEAFSRAIQWGCVKDRGMKKTMQKIDKANLIHDSEESKEGKLLRFYFNEAREKDDPTFLLKAYTINGSFYNYFNKYMATGSSKEVFDKLCHGWSGCYTGAIMKNPKLDSYRFSGITYRGMVMNRENLEQYKPGVVLTNKAFQSTSKLPQVSLVFARVREPTPEKVSVLIQYTIIDRKSALDIRTLSEFPEEEEVLMVPGSLFKVDYINKNVDPCQIFLRQLPWTHE